MPNQRQITVPLRKNALGELLHPVYSVKREGPSWKFWLHAAEYYKEEGEELAGVDINGQEVQFSFEREVEDASIDC